MKKLALIFTTICVLFLVSCENPSKSMFYTDEGAALMMRYGKYEEAEKSFTKAIRYDHDNYEAYYYRGCAKINAVKYADAIEDFEKAIEIKPDYADAYFNLGRVYFLMQNEDKACEYYKLADQYGRPNLDDYLKRCN